MMNRSVIGLQRLFRCRHISQLAMLLLMAISSQALLAPSASAQGTMGTVPDPISATELDGYARRLGLSAQQRAALEQFHEQYRAAFSTLREGEIEQFLNDNPLGGGGRQGNRDNRGNRGGRGPGAAGLNMMLGNVDRQAVEESLKKLESINAKIKALDNTLFDQIQSLVTEEQLLLMPGVRQARERERYRVGVSRMTAFTNPSTNVDLSEIVAGLTLSPDERTNVTPLVTTYESSLTNAVRKLHDTANQATLKMAEQMAALNQGAAQNQGGRQRGGGGGRDDGRFEAFRQVWRDTMLEVNEKASDISELNRRTERSIHAVLAPDNARRLRDEFFTRAYPETRGSTNTARAFEVALGFEDLTDEQRSALAAMNDTFRASLDSLNAEMADLIDANRKTQTFFSLDDESRRTYEQRLSALRDKRSELVDSVRSQLESTLGPDLAAQLERRVAENRDRQREERRAAVAFLAAPDGGMAAGAMVRIEGRIEDLGITLEGVSSDPFLPAPITQRDLEAYAARLGLNEDDRLVLSGLHADYTDRYKQLEETQIKAVRDAEQNLWGGDREGERTPPTDAMIDNLYSLRRQVIESIKQLDAAFFDDLQLALLAEDAQPMLERLRQSRLRSVYNRAAGRDGMFTLGGTGGRRGGGDRVRVAFAGGGPGGGGSEAAIDLSSLVEQTRVTPTDPAQLDAALAEYEVSATSAFQTLFDASMRMRQTMEKLTLRRDGNDGRPNPDARQAMETEGRASAAARNAMIALNRSALERVCDLLEPSSGEELRQAYNRRAFPDVFRDRNSAGPRIDAALALTDLTDSQREQLNTIAGEFRTAYDALCNQLIDLERDASGVRGPGEGGNFDPQAFQERMRNREKIEFEREDLSARMLVRLRATLSPDQAQRIGLETAG